MEELEPCYRGLPDPSPIYSVIRGFTNELANAHYRGLMQLEEELTGADKRKNITNCARRMTYFLVPALVTYIYSC